MTPDERKQLEHALGLTIEMFDMHAIRSHGIPARIVACAFIVNGLLGLETIPNISQAEIARVLAALQADTHARAEKAQDMVERLRRIFYPEKPAQSGPGRA